MNKDKNITPDTRMLLIQLAEGFADGVRNETFKFTEAQGRQLVSIVQSVLTPQPKMKICNITQACNYLDISQPTFRKYVKEGRLPQGQKIAGFTELVWEKTAIEKFKKEYRQ